MNFEEPISEVDFYETQTAAYPVTISDSVRECATDCVCDLQGTSEPHSSFIRLDEQTGQVRVITSFPSPSSAFTAGKYTTRLTVACTSFTLGQEAHTTVIVHWHPRPIFRQSTSISVLDNTPANAFLTLLAPENQFPYPLQYATTSINVTVNPDTGAVHIPSALSTGTHPVGFTVAEIGQPPVNTLLDIIVTSSLQPAKFREDELVIACDSSLGGVLSVDLGTDSADDVNFEIFGELETCVDYKKVITVPQADGAAVVTVTVTKRSDTFCGLNFQATLVLHSPRGSHDTAVLKFSECPGKIVRIHVSLSLCL